MFSKKAVYDPHRSGAVKGAKARAPRAPRAERRVTCRTCNGARVVDIGEWRGSQPVRVRCEACNGAGQVTE